MNKPSTTNSGTPVRDLPKPAIDNRAGQYDPGQGFRGSHGTPPSASPVTSQKGEKK